MKKKNNREVICFLKKQTLGRIKKINIDCTIFNFLDLLQYNNTNIAKLSNLESLIY